MRSRLFSRLAAAGLAALGMAAPARANDHDFNIWLGQFATINASDSVYVRLEAQERFTDDADRLGQLLLRSLVAYRLDPTVSLGAGYAYILTRPDGRADLNEHRFYQELNVRLLQTAGGVTVDSRTRIEQRTFEERNGTAWRLRQFVQLRVPITGRNKLVAYTEPFIDLNQTDVQRGGVSLWRNFAGVSVPLANRIEMVPGYLNQHVFRDGRDRSDHVANVNLVMTF
ncbi:DUF2490 domain-containing protein [Blastomonas sp.]|uniref:DUF2490 domain-containing protein n=1 Tax=Blastomonas sp. TaxID=1909299 RepID=UPI00260B9CC4|nr:DUF2490 domain-containing protein [Blastomonas sp.]MDM7955783.1 DUF2490 domain-containing protein [Blastomonas sp.]